VEELNRLGSKVMYQHQNLLLDFFSGEKMLDVGSPLNFGTQLILAENLINKKCSCLEKKI